MAAVIGDFVPDSSHFHITMIANPSIQHQHSHDSSPYRSVSRSRQSQHSTSTSTSTSSSTVTTTPRAQRPDQSWSAGQTQTQAHVSATGGASRFPSPPHSSSPCVATGPPAAALDVDDEKSASMASVVRDSVPIGNAASRASTTSTSNRPTQQQPSPASDDFQISQAPPYSHSGVLAPQQPAPEQTVIHIRDLAHIQSLANADQLSGNGATGILNDPPLQQMKYEISGMPINDIIEMVAALLTKITTTNDLQHDAMQRNATHQQQANQTIDSDITPLNHSVLAFHGKNVPAITILSYLSRIHKYCPTTYEVFLSLLVYFDRMTERVNDIVAKSEAARRQAEAATSNNTTPAILSEDTPMRDDSSIESVETDSDLVDTDEDMEDQSSRPSGRSSKKGASTDGHSDLVAATYFVVDSFNIHRLIISGVTCASKFFSDVFYTNSRYAKVGGLPLVELNHLELQFLLLNDFRLAVPVEDLEAYATMLVEFYAREVVAKKPSTGASD